MGEQNFVQRALGRGGDLRLDNYALLAMQQKYCLVSGEPNTLIWTVYAELCSYQLYAPPMTGWGGAIGRRMF